MIKNVIYSSLELRRFLNQSNYDTISIEGIKWAINKDSICEPFIIAKLIAPLPPAVAEQKYLVFKNHQFPFNPSIN